VTSGDVATVGGGEWNWASEVAATVAGGAGNAATWWCATVGGGHVNAASGIEATVAGGAGNTASGSDATVGDGYGNTASGPTATISGGGSNIAGGEYATVGGGYGNAASGGYSFASGLRAKAVHPGAYVWSDFNEFDTTSTAANEFRVRATGGAVFVTGIDGVGTPTAGMRLAANGSGWIAISDRNAKTDFAPVDTRAILERVAGLPMESWRYKSQDASVRHIGPMAQDFHSAFGLGEDARGINSIDADGVALAAIQGLYQLVKEKDAALAAQQERIAALEARLLEVEKQRSER